MDLDEFKKEIEVEPAKPKKPAGPPAGFLKRQ